MSKEKIISALKELREIHKNDESSKYYFALGYALKNFEKEDNMSISQGFTCICGNARGWIVEGKEIKGPYPYCGRRYRREYDSKTLSIKAIEIKENK